MTFWRATLFALALVAAAETAWGQEESLFPEIDALFLSGDFQATARRVNEVMTREQDLAPDRRAALYLMKARLELAFGRTGEIRLWLSKAYAAKPSMTLDPVKDPPQLVAAWNEVRAESKPPEQDAIKANALDSAPTPSGDAESGRAVRRALAYFPFGVAQANNQQPHKALAIGGMHLALVGIAALTPGKTTRNVALGLFAVSWGYSIYDGRKNRTDVSVVPVPGHRNAGVALAIRTEI